jgi:hypothetical protein
LNCYSESRSCFVRVSWKNYLEESN